MSKLVEELKKEHAMLLNVFDVVGKLGIVSQEGRKKLIDAKTALLAHLKKEDEEFYPAIKKAAEKDEELKNTIAIFAADMDEISKSVMNFFNKYSSGGSGVEFAKDVGVLLAALKARIRKEENILYREYEKINP